MSDAYNLPSQDANPAPNPGNRDTNSAAHLPAQEGDAAATPAARPHGAPPHGERRSRRRAVISAPVRVRSVDVTEGGPDEVTTTLDVSRGGLLFVSSQPAFSLDMVVAVTFPYIKSQGLAQAEQEGRVARCTQLADGRCAVAVILGSGAGEDLVDSSGHKLVDEKALVAPAGALQRDTKKPLVLVVDADMRARDTVKVQLTGEGYQVMAVGTAEEAHEVLKMFTPSLLIAEIEGEDLPGYALCAYVKTTPRLQTVPVVLMTSSAYPSDYASAHSLGAVVCMAKPYRQERLAHIVRLLAPTDEAKAQTAPARPADLTRRAGGANAAKPAAPGATRMIDSMRKRFRPSR